MEGRRYRHEGFCVRPKRKSDIQFYAENVRLVFFPIEHNMLDVVRLVEHELPRAYENFRFDVVSDEELPGQEAAFLPSEFSIRVRESVYERACDHDGRSRFTLAHELGHFFMHRDQMVAFGRSAENESIPLYMNSEWQADEFARNLLVPVRLAKGMTTAVIATVFEVSKEVARIVRREASAMFKIPTAAGELAIPEAKGGYECLLPGLDWNAM